MLGAFANGVDVPVVAAGQAVVDQNAPADVQPGHPRQVHIGPNAGGDERQVTVQHAAVPELQAAYAVIPQDGRSLLFQMKPHAGTGQATPQQVGGRKVQLLIHQPAHQVDDIDGHASVHQAGSGLQPQQPAADNRRLLGPGRGISDNLPAVVQRAKDKRPFLIGPFVGNQPVHRRHKRHAAGGDDQLVIRQQQAAGAIGHLPLAVNPNDGNASVEGNAVGRVPLPRVDEYVRGPVRPGEDARQQDAVVIPAILVANHGNVIAVLPAQGHHFLNKAGPRHSVADHHQPLFGRCCSHSSLPP